MDRSTLADFLRARREALQPEDVGLPRTGRRRTGGLRREEVAELSNISSDYYSRLEQQRGPRPSEQLLSSLADGLRLPLDERDYLYRLVGYAEPPRASHADHINPGIGRIFDQFHDTPAMIVNHLGETLAQNRMSVLLIGDQTVYTGMSRSLAYRWFIDAAERPLYPPEDQARHSRTVVGHLRAAYGRFGSDPRVTALVDALLDGSVEFAEIWDEHPVLGPHCPPKNVEHPWVGALELVGESLVDPDQSQILTVFTARPGGESSDKLHFLSMFG